MSEKPNSPGWQGSDEQGRQQCQTCGKWTFPVIHSCTGVWGGSARIIHADGSLGPYLDGRPVQPDTERKDKE